MSSFFLSFLVSPFPIYMVNRISLVSKPIQISPDGMVDSASKSLSMGAVRMPLVLCVRRWGFNAFGGSMLLIESPTQGRDYPGLTPDFSSHP